MGIYKIDNMIQPPAKPIIARYRFERNGMDYVGGHNCSDVGTPMYNNLVQKEGQYSFGMGVANTDYLSCPASLNAIMSNKTDYMIDFQVWTNNNSPGGGGDTWWETNNISSFIQTIYGGLRVFIQGNYYLEPFGFLPEYKWTRITLRSTSSSIGIYINKNLQLEYPASGDLGLITSMTMGRYSASTLLDNVYYIDSSDLNDLP